MIKSAVVMIALVISILIFGGTSALGQGGWRQWQVRLTDGTAVEASPLQLRADGKFTRSMDPKEIGYDRSQIDYFAAIVRNKDAAATFPPVPTGTFKQDLIVFLDGKRSLGKVTFKSLKFSEGAVLQNGKEMTLENIAYIKFSRLVRKTTRRN